MRNVYFAQVSYFVHVPQLQVLDPIKPNELSYFRGAGCFVLTFIQKFIEHSVSKQ